MSQKPHRCRTWAPRGETPLLEFNFNWQKLSVSAGLTLRNFYFRLYPGAIGELEVIDFLKALVRHIDGPLMIVWTACRRIAVGWCESSLNSRKAIS